MWYKIFKICIIISVISSLFTPSPLTAYTDTILISLDYLGLIQQRVNFYSIYPHEAEMNGWEGVVKVKFTVTQDGRIKEIDIAESSGYPLLDAAAILAIKDASPYPFPENYSGNEIEITLPVDYRQAKNTAQSNYAKKTDTKPLTTQPEDSNKVSDAQPQFQDVARSEEITPSPTKSENPELNRQEPLPQDTSSLDKAEPQSIAQNSLPNVETALLPLNMGEPAIENSSSSELKSSTTPSELLDFIEIALKNNQPSQVAKEEIELAQLKVIEAQRGFFPNLKIQGYNTNGEVFKIDYEEREAKIQVEQPIYYSGRLTETLNQARANFEITQKNYDRLKFDVMHKAETSYYNLIAAQIHLQKKEAILKEAREILNKVEKLASLNMVIPLELNSSKAVFQQIEFQIKSIQQEIFMAELTFRQVLNTRETPTIATQELDAQRLNLDFDKCLRTALQHRPELYLSELLVNFNEYGKKVEVSKNKLTVDFVGSYGKYEGHYKTEPWKESENWYAGVKIIQPWGPSTFNSSYSSETTQPRFGQTSPTKSTTLSGEFALIDNFKRISDKRKTDVDLQRSLSDFNETAKTISFEVQDAFLNYQKALLQLDTAESEMRFRRNELQVVKIRAMVGEASISNAIESLMAFSESETKHIQAIANYYISLANLKKATGYGLKI